MSTPYPRDLIGYAGKPPNPKWPGDARLAINFVMNYEEGSEYSVPDGDGFSEAHADRGGRQRRTPSPGATSPPRACSSTAAASASGA